MKKDLLQKYLYENIPISKAMGIEIEEASLEKVVLSTSFAPNINHKKTVFGGSLHAAAIFACWSLLYLNLDHSKEIVIVKSEISYKAPVLSDFKAICIKPEKMVWDRFIKTLRAKGKAKILLSAKIGEAVYFQGYFAALTHPGST